MQFSRLIYLTLFTIIARSKAQNETSGVCVYNYTPTTTITTSPTGLYRVYYTCPTSPVYTNLQCCSAPIDDTHKREWMGCKDTLLRVLLSSGQC